MYEHPFPGNRLRHVELDPEEDDYGDSPGPVHADRLEEANLVTSEMEDDSDFAWLTGTVRQHRLVIDIDHRVKVVESTTSGHFHLYIDVPMSWHSQAVPLLRALADAGVVEPGYVAASEARGYTAVRLPWVKKVFRRAVA